jgi:hypothetical protein
MATESIQPATIQGILGTGVVQKAYALIAALQLDVFSALQDRPRSVDELAPVVGGEPGRLASLLYYLVAAGLLSVADGRFANTPEADRYLVRGRPGSYVDLARLLREIYHALSTTAESIRAGRALAAHDFAAMSREEMSTVLRGLDAGTRVKGAWLANTFDLTSCRNLIDVGGGAGGLCIALTERLPHLRATVADLPVVVSLTEQFVAEAHATSRVGTSGVDVLAGPLPGSYDIAVLCSFVQVFGPQDASRVLRNVAPAVTPGGLLIIIGAVVDDSHLAPPIGVEFNYGAISFYEQGQAYTETEYRAWLEEAGFGEIAFRWDAPPEVNAVIITARKRN